MENTVVLMYTQAPNSDHPPSNDLRPASTCVRRLVAVLSVACLAVAFCADVARAQVSAFKLTRGHISQLIVDQGAQLARMIRVDARGREVGEPFDVLVQHRSGPEDQAIDERWARADSIITCFPATIEDPQIRAKAILNDKFGAIKIRRYASGIVIVESVDTPKQPEPVLLAGPVQ